MREELKLQEWVDRIHDETYSFLLPNNPSMLFFYRFKSNITRDKPHPRMLISEEPYIEPTKIERISLRDTNKNQWVTDKVRPSLPSILFHSFLSFRVFDP